jgi:hypothetical protein
MLQIRRSTSLGTTQGNHVAVLKATPSFEAALKALSDGIQRRDRGIPSFLGIYLD